MCIQLYGEDEKFKMQEASVAQVFRINFSTVILKLLNLNNKVNTFPFIEKIPQEVMKEGEKMLQMIGAIERDEITKLGRKIEQLGLEDPRDGKILIDSYQRGCVESVSAIYSLLSNSKDLFSNIEDMKKKNEIVYNHMKDRRSKLIDETSDHMTLLNVWKWYQCSVIIKMGSVKNVNSVWSGISYLFVPNNLEKKDHAVFSDKQKNNFLIVLLDNEKKSISKINKTLRDIVNKNSTFVNMNDKNKNSKFLSLFERCFSLGSFSIFNAKRKYMKTVSQVKSCFEKNKNVKPDRSRENILKCFLGGYYSQISLELKNSFIQKEGSSYMLGSSLELAKVSKWSVFRNKSTKYSRWVSFSKCIKHSKGIVMECVTEVIFFKMGI